MSATSAFFSSSGVSDMMVAGRIDGMDGGKMDNDDNGRNRNFGKNHNKMQGLLCDQATSNKMLTKNADSK